MQIIKELSKTVVLILGVSIIYTHNLFGQCFFEGSAASSGVVVTININPTHVIVKNQNCDNNWYNFEIAVTYNITVTNNGVPVPNYTFYDLRGTINMTRFGNLEFPLPRKPGSGTSQTVTATRYAGDCETVTVEDMGIESISININAPNFNPGGNGKLGLPCSFPLSVDLLNFTAKPNDRKVELKWSTATESNNDLFNVERSPDGKSWQKIGTVSGSGNSTSSKYYSWEDQFPGPGTNYYRLEQVDLDHRLKLSDIVSVNFTPGNNISIYPNPVKKYLTISGVRNERKITLHSMQGLKLRELVLS